jgi:hypothetical protein
MAKGNRSGNQQVSQSVTNMGNNAKQIIFTGEEKTQDAMSFPLVETGDHITGEAYDPLAQREDDITEAEGLEIKPEAQENPQVEAVPVGENPEPKYSIDDPRFKDKEPTDILKSYHELERKFKERDDELGNYRKMFDQHVQSTFAKKEDPKQPPVDDRENQKLLEEMLSNPQAFVQKVEQRVLGQLNNIAAQYEMQAVQAKTRDVITSPEFKQWLTQNVPYPIAQMADQDPATYNWIINHYKSFQAPKQAISNAKEEAIIKRKVVDHAAGLPSSAPSRSKPVYTRSSIMKLMRENPAEYERLQEDIMLAYKEGRVK